MSQENANAVYKAAFETAKAELQQAEAEFEKLNVRIFALNNAVRGLGCLVGEYHIVFDKRGLSVVFSRDPDNNTGDVVEELKAATDERIQNLRDTAAKLEGK